MASASINLDGGNILEEKAEIFYHELFSRHLRVPHATFVIAHAVIMLQDGGGDVVGLLVCLLRCPRMVRHHCHWSHWLASVQPRCSVLARMGEAPNRWGGPGVAWKGKGDG